MKESPVLLEDSPIVPKKYTVPLKRSQIANNVATTVFDSGERQSAAFYYDEKFIYTAKIIK